MKVVTTEKKPIKMWLEDIEDGALDQAKDLANLPFCFKHVAIMPDAHQGYGMPIGGVFAAEDVVIPNAVGVDIGCGMQACSTILTSIDDLEDILQHIRRNVPVGFSHHNVDQKWNGFDSAPDLPIIQQELSSARRQLGTLGGGNHFIEIQKGSDGYIWLMVHSGSRNFGYKIAKHYNDLAKDLCEKWHSETTKDLAFLPGKRATEYLDAMNYALAFAEENRRRIMACVKQAMIDATIFGDDIDIHHNYARLENHYGKNVMVHRKGATSAKEGELGIIPGSQGTSSYIVQGKGNPESFMSCSHGAGRKMGRIQARKTLDLQEQCDILDRQGIIHTIRTANDLDEAPGAYKDIHEVMRNQEDLVDILVELKPLAVVKG